MYYNIEHYEKTQNPTSCYLFNVLSSNLTSTLIHGVSKY